MVEEELIELIAKAIYENDTSQNAGIEWDCKKYESTSAQYYRVARNVVSSMWEYGVDIFNMHIYEHRDDYSSQHQFIIDYNGPMGFPVGSKGSGGAGS